MRVWMQHLPRWSLLAFALFVVAGLAVLLISPATRPTRGPAAQEPAAPIPAPVATGVGVDPLTPDEVGAALAASALVRSADAGARRHSLALEAGQASIEAPVEEVLLVERHTEEKQAVASGAELRRADVYIYRYADDTLVHGIYNYATGQLEQTEEVQDVQLPLTEVERDLAVRLAFNDPALFAHMQEEFRTITGEMLTGPDQLEIRAFTYISGAAPEIEPPEAQACGRNRCAQLLILTQPNNITFNVLPIINLSRLATASVVPLAIQTGAHDPHAHHEHGEGGQ